MNLKQRRQNKYFSGIKQERIYLVNMDQLLIDKKLTLLTKMVRESESSVGGPVEYKPDIPENDLHIR